MGDQSAPPITWAQLGEYPEDGLRREIVDGQLLVTPAPSLRHQWVSSLMTGALLAYVQQFGWRVFSAPFDVVFDDGNAVQPDLVVFSAVHVDRLSQNHPRAIPDLAVEISSPSTKGTDRLRKRALYERFGVGEYWIVALDEDRLEAYRLDGGHYGPPVLYGPGDTVGSGVLAGFEAPFEQLVAPAGDEFANPPR